MKCEVKLACDGVELIVGDTITPAVYARGEKRCAACTNARSTSMRSNERIEITFPDGETKVYAIGSGSVRKYRDLGYLERRVSANTLIPHPATPPVLPYSTLTPQEQRIIDERKDAYEPQDRKEQQRREGSVYCRVLGARKVNGRMTPVCKIGYAGVVKDREQECDRWSIDGDEVTAWRIEHTNARWLETEVHNELKMRGKHRRKEIFNVTPAEAKQIAETVLEMAGYDNTHRGFGSEQPTAGSD